MKRGTVILLLLGLSWCRVSADETGAGGGDLHALSIGLRSAIQSSDTEVSKSGSLSVTPELTVEYVHRDSCFLLLSLPYFVLLRTDEGVARPLRGYWGDPSVEAGVRYRAGAFRMAAGVSYAYPLGIWQPGHAESVGFASGSGFHVVAVSGLAAAVKDPAAIRLQGRYALGLRRTAPDAWTVSPGLITLDLSLMESLNTELAVRVGITQRLQLPGQELRDTMRPTRVRFGTSAHLTVIWSRRNLSVAVRYAAPAEDGSGLLPYTELFGSFRRVW